MTISKDDTVILDGAGDKKAIEERCEQVCLPSSPGASFPFIFDWLLISFLYRKMRTVIGVGLIIKIFYSNDS